VSGSVPSARRVPASCGFRQAQPTSSWRLRLIGFTAHYGPSHRVGLVQAHSLDFCVCENGLVSGESGGRFIVPVRTDAHWRITGRVRE
jgi:hypothetical protein